MTIRKVGGKAPLEYLIYTFTQAFVVNHTTQGVTSGATSAAGTPGASGDYPLETVEFSYATVHLKYTPQKPDGTGDSPIEGGWDLTQNVAK